MMIYKTPARSGKSYKLSREYKQQLGKRLKKLRKYYGYSQKQVSEFLGIDQSNYSKIERGERYIISLSKYEKLSDLYMCSVDFLLCESDDYVPYITEGIHIYQSKKINLEIIAQMNSTMKYLKMLRKIERRN